MSETRSLIVNADDFGQSHGINRGIIRAIEQGIVTSVSIMVRWPAAEEAARNARAQPHISAGLHFDLGEWACRDGEWVKLYDVVSDDDAATVSAELERQLARFRELTGRLPTHLDSHQHRHRHEPVLSAMREAAVRLGVPLRDFSPIQYRGDFYGQTASGEPLPYYIGVRALNRVIRTLPAGVTELGCHPGEGEDLETMYLHEREREVETLCDPRVRACIAQQRVRLCSFREVAGERHGGV